MTGSPAADKSPSGSSDPADQAPASDDARDGKGGPTRRRRLVFGAVVTAALLVACGLTVYLVLFSVRTDTDAARDVAERFASATERAAQSNGRSVDPAEFSTIVCSGDLAIVRKDVTDRPMEESGGATGFRVTVKDVRVDGDRGSVTLTAEISGPDGQRQSGDETLDLVRENGEWRVCGLQRD